MALRAKTDANTVIVGDLNIPLSPIDRPSRQKINKEPWLISTEHFTHQQGNTHSFLQLMELSLKKDHILGHKAILNKFSKIKITLCIMSDHNRIKLDFKNKRNPRKYSNTWRLNNRLPKNQWMTEVIREEIKNFLESNEHENTTYENQWDTEKPMLSGKFIGISASIKKTETSQVKKSNDAP
jgi:hypothetical protein